VPAKNGIPQTADGLNKIIKFWQCHEITNSKIQITNKSQIPVLQNIKLDQWDLSFDIWDLSGICLFRF
jgi:hypothetical protein